MQSRSRKALTRARTIQVRGTVKGQDYDLEAIKVNPPLFS